MTLPVTPRMATRLAGAADSGLDVAFVVVVEWGGSVGTRYYATRELPLSNPAGLPWEAKLLGAPEVIRRSDPSVLRFDALNDDITVRLRNTPEGADGEVDALRLQTLMSQVPVLGARVQIGVVDLGPGATWGDIKWDGVYRIDRPEQNNQEVRLYCVDRLLQPGEKMIGAAVSDEDFPQAPEWSYGQVRGPVFGKVEGLPLIPVEVGMQGVLAAEIDAFDGVIDISAEEIRLWPPSGYVEVGAEIIYYPVIDRGLQRLGSASSPCRRGFGFPNTTVAAHGAGVLVREVYTGRQGLLQIAMTTATTTIEMSGGDFPAQGIVMIEDEAIYYYTRSGTVLSDLMRGVPVPTLARVHDIGTPVRTFPVGPDGRPRYRYMVAEGAVAAVGNLRVVDEDGGDLPYSGAAPVLSQVTGVSGTVWSVVDLADRARVDKYESSGSQVDQEWICETTGEVDAEGVATAASFLRWKPGALMSPEHLATWPRAIDPTASTRAVILEAAPGKNIFSVEFDAGWDDVLNNPRERFGRFRNARVHVRVQYDRATTTMAQYGVFTNGLMVKTGVLQPPALGGAGDGSVYGQQQLPQSRWQTQLQTRDVRLSPRSTGSWGNGHFGYWVDPVKIWGAGGWFNPTTQRPDHSAVISGDTRQFVSGGWSFLAQTPLVKNADNPGIDMGALGFYSNDTFPAAGSLDRLHTLVVEITNPVGASAHWTGWRGYITTYAGVDYTGHVNTWQIGIGRTEAKRTHRIPLKGISWGELQSLRLQIEQWSPGGVTYGATVGTVHISIEYEPDVEGQRVGTLVDGSYFRTTTSTTPSAVFDQVVSLGATVKDVARQYGVDPWMFFTNLLGEGMRFGVMLPTSGDDLQFAVADVQLEVEYDARTVVYDGTVRADVDGRVGTPVGGGTPRVLENATDVLAYLVDSAEYLEQAGSRHAGSWTAAREMTELVGWRVARAVTERISVNELVSSLASESRQLLLADGLSLYCRVRMEEAAPAESVRTVGDQANPAYALVSDQVQVVNRMEDIANSLGCYYRRNYLTGDFRAVVEVRDEGSIELYRLRRATPNLDWHQSARGYVGGLPEQRDRLSWLTDYMLTMSARRWDYATLELPASAVEDLQRYDVLTINAPRSGFVNALGRVVSLQRVAGPLRWQVTLQMPGGSAAGASVILLESPDKQTSVRLVEAGARMDFYVNGVLEGQLTSAGDFRVRGVFLTNTNGWAHAATPSNQNGILRFYRLRRGLPVGGPYELLWVAQGFSLGVIGWSLMGNYGGGGSPIVRRSLYTNVAMPSIGGQSGIVDTATATETGRLEFYLANRLVAYIDNDAMWLRGNLVTNLGARMGIGG